MKTIGREIRKARIDKGLNQKELADRLGMKQQYLSRIEHDEIDVRASMLQKIAAALGVPVAQLLPDAPAEGGEKTDEEYEPAAVA